MKVQIICLENENLQKKIIDGRDIFTLADLQEIDNDVRLTFVYDTVTILTSLQEFYKIVSFFITYECTLFDNSLQRIEQKHGSLKSYLKQCK